MQLTSFLENSRLTIALTGEIDHHRARTYIDTIAAKIDAYTPAECILDFSDVFLCSIAGGRIRSTVLSCDKLSCCLVCFIRNSCRVGTQVCDKTDRAMTFHFNTFIKLLSQTHCFLCREIQCFGCFLLKCTCCKWNRRFFHTLSVFYIRHNKSFIL